MILIKNSLDRYFWSLTIKINVYAIITNWQLIHKNIYPIISWKRKFLECEESKIRKITRVFLIFRLVECKKYVYRISSVFFFLKILLTNEFRQFCLHFIFFSFFFVFFPLSNFPSDRLKHSITSGVFAVTREMSSNRRFPGHGIKVFQKIGLSGQFVAICRFPTSSRGRKLSDISTSECFIGFK